MTLLTGSLAFSGGACTPSGLPFCIGLDGKHYLARCSTSDGDITSLACAETNAIGWTKSTADWRTDFGTLGYSPTGTFYPSMCWAAPGTPYFYIVGWSYFYDNTLGRSLAVGVRYKIADTTTATVDGAGFCYSCSGTSLLRTPDVGGFQYAMNLIGANLYVVCRYSFASGNVFLTKIALAGGSNLASGSWESLSCAMTGGLGVYNSSSSRLYTNRSSIIQDPAGIGVFFYGTTVDGLGYSNAKLLYTVVNPTTMTAGSQADRSAEFGIPFADDGLNFAGASSGNSRDQYTCPSVTGSAGNELIFGRTYSDARQTIGMRRFSQDISTGVVTSLGASSFQGTTSVFGAPLDQVQFYRETGQLNSVMDNEQTFYFGGQPSVARTYNRVWG